ncbi:esterase/lipase family protein [Aromatoleum diolicum]|uniref:Alpha/beta fold hydrolase n=1 Tax=Aromatoleum diolicum TaxID=75796 RepID=A0ABX1QBS1_9RHOO|nr:alpha/beta hydrolase [Aromatoleum diolicum]NMG75783.1 alpha/beta fold hydrolase [Aromatoleum diolicum]
MNTRGETVVLVHGLWMHGLVFGLMRRRLGRYGFATQTWSYPSVRHGLAANAQGLARFLASLEADTIHLVGHSLGGLLVLSTLARHPDPRVRRVVLMGPPYGGSRSAATLMRVPGFSAIVGRSMRDWLATPPPQGLDGIDIGVLAGCRGLGLAGTLVRLPKPNDGVVMVDETRVAQARDTITLTVNHTEMLFSRHCTDQVAAFLRSGAFVHSPDTPDATRQT